MPKRNRWHIPDATLTALEGAFERNPFPTMQDREVMAQAFGVTPRNVQVWFQNKRQRRPKACLPLAQELPQQPLFDPFENLRNVDEYIRYAVTSQIASGTLLDEESLSSIATILHTSVANVSRVAVNVLLEQP